MNFSNPISLHLFEENREIFGTGQAKTDKYNNLNMCRGLPWWEARYSQKLLYHRITEW